jgi:hypothetical protein
MFERENYEAQDIAKSKLFRIFLSSCGLTGCLALIIYFSAPFVLFPFPSANTASTEIIANVTQYQFYYLMAAWLQGSGTFLIVIFVLGLVYISDAWKRFAGWITILASSAVLMLSLMEGTFFLGAVQGIVDGHANTTIASLDLTFVFLHSFFIAPSILLPLAFVLRWSRLLPKFLWHWALILGASFGGIGLVGLFLSTSVLAISLLILMIAWMITSSVELLVSSHSQK